MRAFGVSFLTSLLLMAGIAQADRLVVVEWDENRKLVSKGVVLH